jgi:two-component system sensor histidine kinase/response regulator
MLDLVMPDMDGWDTYERIRQLGNLHHVPITIYSSSTDSDDKTRAQEIGAVDFIKKPCKKDELLARLKAIIEKSDH